MTRASAQGARFRQRKLSTKQHLQILREDQVEKLDDETQRNVPKVDTGVEKAEELEHHLQVAISASHAATDGKDAAYIPTPDAMPSKTQYDDLYQKRFSQPATYIAFSTPLEECVGVLYCMDEDDAVALKILNQKRSAVTQCSELQFEQIMNFFEDTANDKHKYAYVDGTPILALEEMRSSPIFADTIPDSSRVFIEDIYEHWSTRRTRSGNKSVQPSLKFETGRESDDGDPYVCFRRREVRQARKTRQRDNQISQKLIKLRQELVDGQGLAGIFRQNLLLQKEHMIMSRQLFEQRRLVKETKRKLNIKGDDEDLINQKPKKKIIDPAQLARALPSHLRGIGQRPAQSSEDLQLLEDIQADKENEIRRDIQTKIAQHNQWNKGYVDWTRNPLTPKSHRNTTPEFRPASVTYLPTPPASASTDAANEGFPDVETPSLRDLEPVRYSSPPVEESSAPSYRRRVGRGGILWIDRRLARQDARDLTGVDPIIVDRFKYDHDEDDDEEQLNLHVDAFDSFNMRYRAHLFDRAAQAQAARRLQAEQAGHPNALLPAGHGSNANNGLAPQQAPT